MKRKYFLTLFLAFQIAFLKVIAFFPEIIEQIYSNGLYLYISKIARIVFGKIPFSVGDIVYVFFIFYQYFVPEQTRIDAKLLLGAVLFGVGRGIAGLCPGPALASLAAGVPEILLFVVAMAVGMALRHLQERRSADARDAGSGS